MAQITLIFKACLVFNNNYYYYYNNITYTYNSHWLQTHCYACVSNKNVFCLFLKVLTLPEKVNTSPCTTFQSQSSSPATMPNAAEWIHSTQINH